jgi:hypothetical protein
MVTPVLGLVALVMLANGAPFSMPGGPLEGVTRLDCPHCGRRAAEPVNDHQLLCSNCGRRCGASWCLQRGCQGIVLGDQTGRWRCVVRHYFYARRCPDCWELGLEDPTAQAYICGRGHRFEAQVSDRCPSCDSGFLVISGSVWTCEACEYEELDTP